MTAEELAEVRALIGPKTPPSDADLNAAYVRLGSAAAVALEVLQGRYADLISSPAKWAVEGDFSVDNTETIRRLAGVIASLEADAAGPLTMTVHSMTRADRAGR